MGYSEHQIAGCAVYLALKKLSYFEALPVELPVVLVVVVGFPHQDVVLGVSVDAAAVSLLLSVLSVLVVPVSVPVPPVDPSTDIELGLTSRSPMSKTVVAPLDYRPRYT